MPMIVPLGSACVAEALRRGEPAVVPLPSPLPYVVVARDPQTVNGAKGRPLDQAVGVGVADLRVVSDALALGEPDLRFVDWLLTSEQASVLVPVGTTVPTWLAPAVRDGLAFIVSSWLPAHRPVIGEFLYLYMSSANLTQSPPAVTATQAQAMFGDRVLIEDGDCARNPGVAHGSTTMLRAASFEDLEVQRHGINNAAFQGDDAAYLTDLRRRYQVAR